MKLIYLELQMNEWIPSPVPLPLHYLVIHKCSTAGNVRDQRITELFCLASVSVVTVFLLFPSLYLHSSQSPQRNPLLRCSAWPAALKWWQADLPSQPGAAAPGTSAASLPCQEPCCPPGINTPCISQPEGNTSQGAHSPSITVSYIPSLLFRLACKPHSTDL